MKVLLATNNKGKLERYRKLLAGTDIELLIPADLGIDVIDVEETGKTLAENAILKASAYLGKVDFPILANDTGFYVEGDGFIAAPKRFALGGKQEKELSQEEIAEYMMEFWKAIAEKHGGEVDAAFPETFALVYPDGTVRTEESRREILLTNREFGPVHLTLPIRSLYISKDTRKPALTHTPEEEEQELLPVRTALLSLLS